MTSLSTTLLEAATVVPAQGRHPHPSFTAASAIEAALRQVASSSEERRAEAHAAIRHRRHDISREKSASLAARTLRNMRGGG